MRSFFKTGNLFGLQYIYGELTNSDGKDPINFPAIMANPSEYHLVVTNAETGKPEYFCKEDIKQDDYRYIMASCAIPAACKPIEIGGCYYYDGGIIDAIPVQKALDDGCDRLVVILSKPRDFIKKSEGLRFLYSRICRKYPNIVSAIDNRHITYSAYQKKVFDLEKEGIAFVFAPSEQLKISTYSMDEKIEMELYNLGMKDFSNQQVSLNKFLI